MLPLHREAEWVRCGDFVWQCRRGAARANLVSALLPYLRQTAPQADRGFPLHSSGGADAVLHRLLVRCSETEHADRPGSGDVRPHLDAFPGDDVSHRRRSVQLRVQACGRPHRSPAAQVAAQRGVLRDPAVRLVLRAAV